MLALKPTLSDAQLIKFVNARFGVLIVVRCLSVSIVTNCIT